MVAAWAVVVALLSSACGGGGRGTVLPDGPSVEGFAFTADSAVAEGEPVPVFFTCDGEEVSPTLAWKGAPEGIAELALVVEDPDAPGGTFTHWLVYGLDPAVDSLPNAVAAEPEMSSPRGLRQGENDFGRIGYAGPCPPGGEHRYVFRLLALHTKVELEPGASRADFDDAVAPHVLAEARLTTVYGGG